MWEILAWGNCGVEGARTHDKIKIWTEIGNKFNREREEQLTDVFLH
jgi:hypothetical protein